MRTYYKIGTRQKHKGHKHTKRYTQCHKEGIGNTHKKHQHNQHQQKSNDDGVYQLIERCFCFYTLVTGDYGVQVFRKRNPFVLGYYLLNSITCFNQVFSTSFYNIKRYYILAIKPCKALRIFGGVFYYGNIFQVYGKAPSISNDHLLYVEGGSKLTLQLQVTFHTTHV